MMLKRAESGKRVARRNGFYTGILTFIVVVCFAAMAIPYAVASVGATSIEGISQNESIVSGNMTTISISNSEQGSNCFSAEPPEELTLTQSPMEETIPSPTEEVIIPNSTANQTSTSEITVTPTPSTLNNSPALEIQSLECVDVPLEYPIYRSSENGPKLTTGNAEFVTDSSAILTGTLSNSDPDILYQIRFRYQISGNDGKFFSQPISVKGNSKFSIPITDLRPGTTYIFRAIGGISDPYINDAPNPSRSFKTAGTELPGTISSISASIDKDLIDYLDELLPDDGNCEYYNSAWEISPAQYKLMILAGIWSEGGKCGYSAHSNCVPDDACTHSAISNFVFSTGIGPAQVDRGQEHILDVGWDNWSTIEKLDWTKSLVSSLRVLKYHLDTCQKKGKLNCIEDMRACIKTTWFGYKIEEEGGLWASDWSAVTGTTWDTVKNGNKSCATLLGNSDITLEDIKGNVKGEWEDYHTVVRKIGKLRWKVMTDADINGYFDTYQILAGRLYGEQNTYYYMNTGSDVKGTEIWAYYNPEDSVHNLKSVFVRDYNAAKLYPLNAFPVTRSGSTISKGVIENMPEVGIFTCTPSNPKVGERIIFNYKVSAPEGVSSVELWRINDASKHDDCNIADDRWELIRSVQSITEIGTIEVISPVTGTHWYGLHVVDDTGAWACEKTPIRLTILEDSHIPEVISPDAGTQYDSDSVCVMINLKDIDIADKYEVVLSDGETRKSKEYSSLPVTITDSEIWGSDLPDGEYTVKYRYHFDENEQYGYSEGYSDFSTSVSFTVGEVEDKKIFFDSAQPYTSVSIKLKERTGTAALPASDSCVESLQNSESPGVYIYRGTTPLNISISDLSQSLPSDIVSSETDSEDYALGDRVEIKFSKYGYATEFVNITLGETENYTVDLASAMPESGLTDLIAKRIFTTTEIRRGEETSFYVEVINDGDVAAGPFNVGLWFFNGTLNFLGKNEVSLIPAKESLVVSGWSVVWPNDNGSYPVIAWVDCDDAVVNETDKINNLFPGIGRATKVNETTKLRPPTLLSPANGSTIDDDTPTFTWSPVEGADYYCLNYSGLDYPYLSTIKELNGASYAHHWLDRFIRDGTFQWNVTSYNITTGCSEVSPDSYFTLKIDRTKLRGPKAIEIGSDG
ncbi:CARDB domain-containing protein [Methanoculleus sp. UBA303]|uniref:CARDB domain-containing protein n=1 Tax=Methanoculleus sp. UBA303 TaxID=1915497 RepID=UPI0025CF616F|nr:CARDB domain-containing protein [Methanoculleus sp. UBA303]